jgi:hypothetical protein
MRLEAADQFPSNVAPQRGMKSSLGHGTKFREFHPSWCRASSQQQFEPLKLLATCRIIAFDWAIPDSPGQIFAQPNLLAAGRGRDES